ncbi:MAG: CPBP family intramembrane metalloprotease [Bacilli bacterium]|nr:CPBP family intramembrane metalloprotease [Bacilli bacterium]
MLNLEDQYQENKNNFEEINNNLEKLGDISYTPIKKDDKNDGKLPFMTKLIIFLCGFSYTGFLLLQLIWLIILGNIFEDKNAANVAILTGTYLTLFVIMIAFAIKNKKYFLSKIKDPTKYLYGLLFGVVTIGIEIIVSYIIQSICPSDVNANQQTVIDFTTSYPTLMFFITVLVGPLCEEFTYRVGLYELLKEKNETLAFILTSIIFAFIHIQFTDTTFLAEITALPVYLTIGFCLTYGYKLYGLPCSYVAHAFLNLISFLSIFAQI